MDAPNVKLIAERWWLDRTPRGEVHIHDILTGRSCTATMTDLGVRALDFADTVGEHRIEDAQAFELVTALNEEFEKDAEPVFRFDGTGTYATDPRRKLWIVETERRPRSPSERFIIDADEHVNATQSLEAADIIVGAREYIAPIAEVEILRAENARMTERYKADMAEFGREIARLAKLAGAASKVTFRDRISGALDQLSKAVKP